MRTLELSVEYGRVLQSPRKEQTMRNLKLEILKHVYARPHLTIGGLADAISPGARTEQEVCNLVDKGYLLDDSGLKLSKRGLACIDSTSFKNRAKRVGIWVLGVVAVVIGNWLWSLIQSPL